MFATRACGLACRGGATGRTPRTRAATRRSRALRSRAAARRRAALPGQSTVRCGTAPFALQCAAARLRALGAGLAAPRRRAAAACRSGPAAATPPAAAIRGTGTRRRRAATAARLAAALAATDGDTGAARLRQADRDRLPGRARAVPTLPHVMDFLADEFTRLRARGLALAASATGSLHGSLLGHRRLLFATMALSDCHRCSNPRANAQRSDAEPGRGHGARAMTTSRRAARPASSTTRSW